jgi:two-component system, NarL family, nitrate/nitrite response regulator NarL
MPVAAPVKKIKVMCVDDNPALAASIQGVLRTVPDIEMLRCLNNADELLSVASQLCPDVILLDIDMPGKNPFQALSELQTACPNVRVIMFSGYFSQELITIALDNGAWGFVYKNDPFQSLLTAIRKVVQGEFAFSPTVQTVYERLNF